MIEFLIVVLACAVFVALLAPIGCLLAKSINPHNHHDRNSDT